MAESADATDLKSVYRKVVQVQILLPAPIGSRHLAKAGRVPVFLYNEKTGAMAGNKISDMHFATAATTELSRETELYNSGLGINAVTTYASRLLNSAFSALISVFKGLLPITVPAWESLLRHLQPLRCL